MEESLINAEKTINASTETILKALEEKTVEPATEERAKIWFEKAELLVKHSKEMYDYLANCKIQLKEKKLRSDSIYKRLVAYEKSVLTIDSSIRLQFQNSFVFPDEVIKTVAALTTLQCNIKIFENNVAAYCSSKVGAVDGLGFFDYYSAIISQNSNHLNPGDELIITAGVGTFSKNSQPLIKFNGKNAELGDEGFALYKIKTPSNPGKYNVPVSISWISPLTGRQESAERYIQYTVAKPCN